MTSPVSQEKPATGTALKRVEISVSRISRTLIELRTQPHLANDSYDELLRRLGEQPLRRRLLFLSSALDGEGTTTTACNLAGALSRKGETVLLAELRLTEPAIFELLGSPPAVPAFESGLRGDLPLDECSFQIAGSALQVMALRSSISLAEATEMSGALNEFIVWAEHAFDWVILDCPPVSSSAWTRWFQLNADPALLVVRSKVAHSRALKRAAKQLKDHLAGAILNDLQAA